MKIKFIISYFEHVSRVFNNLILSIELQEVYKMLDGNFFAFFTLFIFLLTIPILIKIIQD